MELHSYDFKQGNNCFIFGEYSVVINRSALEVFAFISTPENDPQWVQVCVQIHRAKEEPIQVGSRLIEWMSFVGIRQKYEWVVAEFTPGNTIVYKSLSGFIPMMINIFVVPCGVQTKVTQRVGVYLPRFFPFRFLLSKIIGNIATKQNLKALKRKFEN